MIRKYLENSFFLNLFIYFFFISRVRRQTTLLSTIQLRVEIRVDPPASLSTGYSTAYAQISTINSIIINQWQANIIQPAWANLAGGVLPISLNVQEPGNQTAVTLAVISRVALIVPPSDCRVQSACTNQPVLVAYDASGNVIFKLGSNDYPWQVIASVVGAPSGVGCIGNIANYTGGAASFASLGITATGTYQIQFNFVTPNGVSR